MKASRSGSLISHLLFADDCVLIGDASTRGANGLVNILKKYENIWSQCVNYEKFTVFFSANVSELARFQIFELMGVRYSNNPEKYLKLLNMVGRQKKLLSKVLKIV